MVLPSNLTNVTLYGDEFAMTDTPAGSGWGPDVAGGGNDNNIVFDYDTFQPEVASPSDVSCANSYQYAIYNENGHLLGFTVEHSDIWGSGEGIDTTGSTESNPQIFTYNWLHDAAPSRAPCSYHTDGIGGQNGHVVESYATVDHNTFMFLGNTNEISWQNGTYSNMTETNNLLSGDNQSLAPARCQTNCTPPTYITITGNTFDTYLPIYYDPIDPTGSPWNNTGSTWRHNFWAVPPGAAWGSASNNGKFWIPNGTSAYPSDTPFTSATDCPHTGICN
jgi:hypothetical protein